MKNFILKLLSIAIFVLAIKVQAQATFSGSKKDYTQSMDSILTYVDKSPIRTGILYDRVMSFSDLDWLKEEGKPTISNYQHFIQSWSELHRASYNPRFISVENLRTNINANNNPDLVDIDMEKLQNSCFINSS